jgi:hypothetical protein
MFTPGHNIGKGPRSSALRRAFGGAVNRHLYTRARNVLRRFMHDNPQADEVTAARGARYKAEADQLRAQSTDALHSDADRGARLLEAALAAERRADELFAQAAGRSA